MASVPLKIGVLHYQPDGEPADPVVEHIETALKDLGHETVGIVVHNRVEGILEQVEAAQCDLVFNLCETFAEDYRLEVNVAALMEMAGVRYTGSGIAGLLLAQDKILTKQLLGYHEVRTPNYAMFDGEAFEAHGMLNFPLIVKPARTDASIGISGHSVVSSWDDLTRRVRDIRKELNDESLAEEFIEGREVYVGVLGGPTRAEILPIVELDWGNWDPSKPRISDREVKFGPDTEGSPQLVMAADLPEDVRFRIERSALLAFRVLRLRDYARIDFRISEQTGEAYVLEANPNPYLEMNSELAMAAEARGISYTQLIGRIVESAAARYKIKKAAVTVDVPAAAAEGAEPEPARASAAAKASETPEPAVERGEEESAPSSRAKTAAPSESASARAALSADRGGGRAASGDAPASKRNGRSG